MEFLIRIDNWLRGGRQDKYYLSNNKYIVSLSADFFYYLLQYFFNKFSMKEPSPGGGNKNK